MSIRYFLATFRQMNSDMICEVWTFFQMAQVIKTEFLNKKYKTTYLGQNYENFCSLFLIDIWKNDQRNDV